MKSLVRWTCPRELFPPSTVQSCPAQRPTSLHGKSWQINNKEQFLSPMLKPAASWPVYLELCHVCQKVVPPRRSAAIIALPPAIAASPESGAVIEGTESEEKVALLPLQPVQNQAP